jgi:hypothetical protein
MLPIGRRSRRDTSPAFSGDEGTDAGVDGETNVSPDYRQGANAFTGRIFTVTIEQQQAMGRALGGAPTVLRCRAWGPGSCA